MNANTSSTGDSTTTPARAHGTVPALVLRLRGTPSRDEVLAAANQIVEYREMLAKCEQYFAIRNLGQYADKLLADIRDCLKENSVPCVIEPVDAPPANNMLSVSGKRKEPDANT